jgi:hypothetical protein
MYNDKIYKKSTPLLGNIHKYIIWGSAVFDEIDNYKHLPIIKVWTGR